MLREKQTKKQNWNSSSSIIEVLLFPAQSEKTVLVEGVWSLRGEAGFVLATQDPVGQGELDLGVLQEEAEEIIFSLQVA